MMTFKNNKGFQGKSNQKMLKLNQELQKVREAKLNGESGFTIQETTERMRQAIKGLPNDKIQTKS